uniref:Uncharacterized protein n=1 Tax=Rhizophora mucronata TaxID=61149 RepID=A0A2P2PVW5_RHIMU
MNVTFAHSVQCPSPLLKVAHSCQELNRMRKQGNFGL